MKKRLLCFITLLTATISAITLTNNVKAATKWNTSKSVTKEENGIALWMACSSAVRPLSVARTREMETDTSAKATMMGA